MSCTLRYALHQGAGWRAYRTERVDSLKAVWLKTWRRGMGWAEPRDHAGEQPSFVASLSRVLSLL